MVEDTGRTDAFYNDAIRLTDEVRSCVDRLSQTPGDWGLYTNLMLHLDVLCGMFRLHSHTQTSDLIRDIKRRLEAECGENARLTDPVFDLITDLVARIGPRITARNFDSKASEEIVKALREKLPETAIGTPAAPDPEPHGRHPLMPEAVHPSAPVEPIPVASASTVAASGTRAVPAVPPTGTPDMQAGTAPVSLPEWNRSACGEMLGTFLEEADEIVTSLDKDLLELEKTPGNEALVNQIFRSMHTLKGNSATIHLKVMNLVAHRAENILSKVRTKSLTLTSALVDILLDSTEVFKEIIRRIINAENPNLDISQLVNRLDMAATGMSTVPAAHPAGTATGMSVAPVIRPAGVPGAPAEAATGMSASPTPDKKDAGVDAKKIETTSLRVDISKLDTAMNLIGEIVIDRIRLRQKITKLQDIIQITNGIIHALEDQSGQGTHDRLHIVIDDRIGDYVAKLSLDHEVTHMFAGEIASLKQIIDRIMAGHMEYPGATSMMEAASVTTELKHMARMFKDTVHELTLVIEHLSPIANELQEAIMQMRMVPMAQLFDKLPRMVRSLAKGLDKKVRLEIIGAETELDKTVIEKLGDPLMHMIRNSLDHGIGSPADRREKGKAEEGLLQISAEHKGNQVEIAVRDDGQGIDDRAVLNKAIETGLVTPERAATMDRAEILELIFRPGFSSAKKVTEVSGRGVGMDVVLSTIKKMKGTVEIATEVGKGTAMFIRLPLTMSIMMVQLVKCGPQTFAIPISFVEDIIRVRRDEITFVGQKPVIDVRGDITSVVMMNDVLEVPRPGISDAEAVHVVMVKISDKRIGFVVDGIVGQQEIVVKTLGDILKNVDGVSGATILGEGNVILILDVMAVFAKAKRMIGAGAGFQKMKSTRDESREHKETDEPRRSKAILVVDDSKMIRESVSNTLTNAGYTVVVAVDGVDGLSRAKEQNFDLVTSDVEMPRMNGYALVKNLRRLTAYAKKPVVMFTSKADEIDVVRGLDAGADEYLTKPADPAELLRIVAGLLGEETATGREGGA